MLIYNTRLRLPKPNKVDDVAEYLHKSRILWAIQVRECEVLDPALNQQFPHDNEETHQLARIRRKYSVRIVAAHILSCGFHCRRDDFACRVGEEFGEPFEDFLDLLRVGFA